MQTTATSVRFLMSVAVFLEASFVDLSALLTEPNGAGTAVSCNSLPATEVAAELTADVATAVVTMTKTVKARARMAGNWLCKEVR